MPFTYVQSPLPTGRAPADRSENQISGSYFLKTTGVDQYGKNTYAIARTSDSKEATFPFPVLTSSLPGSPDKEFWNLTRSDPTDASPNRQSAFVQAGTRTYFHMRNSAGSGNKMFWVDSAVDPLKVNYTELPIDTFGIIPLLLISME